MCLIAKYSIDRHKPRTNPGHGKGEKQREIRIKKKKKRVSYESIASITREIKRRKKGKKVGEKEKWRFCFSLAHS